MFSGTILWLFRLNPMAHIINAYRDIFYVHQTPQLLNLLLVGVIGIILLIVCYKAFKTLEKRFAEEI